MQDVTRSLGFPSRALPGGQSNRTPTPHGRATNRTRPAPPSPARSEAERIADAFLDAGMRWHASPRTGLTLAQCPGCCALAPDSLTIRIVDRGAQDPDREGAPVTVTCANGCNPLVVAYLLRSWGGWSA
jgi:hypothetical protein